MNRIAVLGVIVVGEFAYLAAQATGADVVVGPGLLWGFAAFVIGGWATWLTKAVLKITNLLTRLDIHVLGKKGLLERMDSAEHRINGFDEDANDRHARTIAEVQEITAGVEGRLEVEKGRIDHFLDNRRGNGAN